MEEMKKAVISILGEDRKGIIANVTRILYEYDVNILDISQTIVSGLFSMILIADISLSLIHICIEQATDTAVAALAELSQPVEGKQGIAQVAAISSGDPVIGDLIADAMDRCV